VRALPCRLFLGAVAPGPQWAHATDRARPPPAALKSAAVAAPAEPGKQRLDAYVVQQLTARLRNATDWLVRPRLTAARGELSYSQNSSHNVLHKMWSAGGLLQVHLVLRRAWFFWMYINR